jgi:hypothetical protein
MGIALDVDGFWAILDIVISVIHHDTLGKCTDK